jgi:hypothetical protein
MKTYTTITKYFVYNAKGKNMHVVLTEEEAQAIVAKNAKHGWTYKVHSWKQETAIPEWALAGYNANPTEVEYGVKD